jgi:hypothetical protein
LAWLSMNARCLPFRCVEPQSLSENP